MITAEEVEVMSEDEAKSYLRDLIEALDEEQDNGTGMFSTRGWRYDLLMETE